MKYKFSPKENFAQNMALSEIRKRRQQYCVDLCLKGSKKVGVNINDLREYFFVLKKRSSWIAALSFLRCL